jgi:hypothetical protein
MNLRAHPQMLQGRGCPACRRREHEQGGCGRRRRRSTIIAPSAALWDQGSRKIQSPLSRSLPRTYVNPSSPTNVSTPQKLFPAGSSYEPTSTSSQVLVSAGGLFRIVRRVCALDLDGHKTSRVVVGQVRQPRVVRINCDLVNRVAKCRQPSLRAIPQLVAMIGLSAAR